MYKQLFIGLGGQGARSIREIRKVIYERELNSRANPGVGEFNLNCAFLSIDSSPDIWNAKQTWVHMGKDLQLTAAERCQLTSGSLNIAARNVVPWLYSPDPTMAREQQAVFDSIDRSTAGAQQRRRYGRALFAANADAIYHSIANAYDRVKASDTENSCMINVFCSLGGGTGSGGIVDLITLLRQIFPANEVVNGLKSYPINLYLYLADQNGVAPDAVQGFFFENQYAALKDLNALSSGLLQPHTLATIQGKNYFPGERTVVDTPLDAVIISTNTTSQNNRISILDQIRRVAEWSVERALVVDGARDSAVAKIVTGEDFTSEVHGEPNDVTQTFTERSYRFASLGAAKWEAPVNQLCLMAMHSILANSFRQMVYNNVTQTEGYKGTPVALDDKTKASFIDYSAEDFLMTDYVMEGWNNWVMNNSEIQTIMQAPQDPQALRKFEAAFSRFYEDKVVGESTTNSAGDNLSLPGRSGKMLAVLKEAFQMRESTATSVSDLLNDHLMRKLVNAWKGGVLGLCQVKEVIAHAEKTARQFSASLKEMYENRLEHGTELSPHERSLAFRGADGTGEWWKLTSLSYKLKGREFLEEHLKDLIWLYTLKTQLSHLEMFRKQMNIFADTLEKFVVRMDTPINYMIQRIKEEEALYRETPLRRFIMDGDKPGVEEELAYDYDSQDPKVKDVVKYVNGQNTPGKPITVVSNAEELRKIVAESISGGSTLAHLFGGNAQIGSMTEENLTSKAYNLAASMLKKADEDVGTKLMGGIITRVQNMSADEVKGKFKRLLSQATFSYLPEPNTPTPANGYGMPSNSYRQAWVISFPEGIRIPGIDSTPEALKAAILAHAGNGAAAHNVFVSTSSDTTKISVWQTQFARPARDAAIVSYLSGRYHEMQKRAAVRECFWLQIDDRAAQVTSPLTFPNREEMGWMREGALWIVKQFPDLYELAADGKVYRKGSTNNDKPMFDTSRMQLSDADITSFAFEVQQHFKTMVERQPQYVHDLVGKYEAVLKSDNREERTALAPLVDYYIRPTAFRIVQAARKVNPRSYPGLFAE